MQSRRRSRSCSTGTRRSRNSLWGSGLWADRELYELDQWYQTRPVRGGIRPLWARNGQELFFVSPAGALERVGVERASSWAATTPTLLVKAGYFTIPGGTFGRTYDNAPDGQRFLMIKEGGGSDQTAAPASLIVVQHWAEELKRLVPIK